MSSVLFVRVFIAWEIKCGVLIFPFDTTYIVAVDKDLTGSSDNVSYISCKI